MRLVNLTPHPITLQVTGNGMNYGEVRDLQILSSGLARLETLDRPESPSYRATDQPVEWPDGGCFNVVERMFGEITGLPEPAERTIYVVSMPVAQRAAELGRIDVYAPDTGSSAIRDTNGQIKAVRGLVKFLPSGRFIREDLYQKILSVLGYNEENEEDETAEFEPRVKIPTRILAQLLGQIKKS